VNFVKKKMPGKHCVGSVRERTGDTTAVRRTVRRLGRRGGADVKAQSDLFKSLSHSLSGRVELNRARFYVPLDTKYVVSETVFPSQSLGSVLKKLNPGRNKG